MFMAVGSTSHVTRPNLMTDSTHDHDPLTHYQFWTVKLGRVGADARSSVKACPNFSKQTIYVLSTKIKPDL